MPACAACCLCIWLTVYLPDCPTACSRVPCSPALCDVVVRAADCLTQGIRQQRWRRVLRGSRRSGEARSRPLALWVAGLGREHARRSVWDHGRRRDKDLLDQRGGAIQRDRNVPWRADGLVLQVKPRSARCLAGVAGWLAQAGPFAVVPRRPWPGSSAEMCI